MLTPEDITNRADEYVRRRGLSRLDLLGSGKDGVVWRTTRPSALKVHRYVESYLVERNSYIRLRDRSITNVSGLTIPGLIDYDDERFTIEMSIVFPPFIVDFASARFDQVPDLIEDEGHTLIDLIRQRFEDRAQDVIAICDELALRAGIYLTDLNPHNLKFLRAGRI